MATFAIGGDLSGEYHHYTLLIICPWNRVQLRLPLRSATEYTESPTPISSLIGRGSSLPHYFGDRLGQGKSKNSLGCVFKAASTRSNNPKRGA